MRNAAFWVTSVVLVAGALSAAVGTATVQWLYPKAAPRAVAAATAAPDRAATQAGPLERLALEAVRQQGRLGPTPLRAARLPGPAGDAASLLVWANYPRENGTQAYGVYQVAVHGDKVADVIGPLAPEGGYRPLPLAPLDEKARKVDMAQFKGKALVLWAPRTPEPGLAEAMSGLQSAYASQGVAVIMVLDVRSPDWLGSARAAGYQGLVWRIKGGLEDVPVPSKGIFLGAAGLLVSRDGLVVASLAALDPGRYGLIDQPVSAIARPVLEAYGLLP